MVQTVDGDGAVGGADRQRHLVRMIGETVDRADPIAHKALVKTYHIYAVTVEIVYADALVGGAVK